MLNLKSKMFDKNIKEKNRTGVGGNWRHGNEL